MDAWLIWLAAALLLVVLLSTAASLSLRLPSRARLAEKMEQLGRKGELRHLLEHRIQLLLATAILRAVALLSFALVLVEGLRTSDAGEFSFNTYLWAFVIALLGVLVFGIAIPSAWARYAGESLLIASLPVLHGLRHVLYPLVAPLLALDWMVRRLAGVRDGDEENDADGMEQEILTVVSEGEARGAVDEEEAEMIESVIELRDTQVDRIMTPRTDISAVPRDVSFVQLKDLIREKGHSRVPVYDDTVDNIVGVIYAKDLLQVADAGSFDAAAIMRGPIYIPESKQTRDLLHEFQEGKGHMAIVLDEYGGTAGLVTIEDILEELVGEIFDEYEAQHRRVHGRRGRAHAHRRAERRPRHRAARERRLRDDRRFRVQLTRQDSRARRGVRPRQRQDLRNRRRPTKDQAPAPAPHPPEDQRPRNRLTAPTEHTKGRRVMRSCNLALSVPSRKKRADCRDPRGFRRPGSCRCW